jgi:hypothetical protein
MRERIPSRRTGGLSAAARRLRPVTIMRLALRERFALAATALLLVVTAIAAPSSQDWIPFQTASLLVSKGLWSDVYPMASAGSLFDVTPRFSQAAASIASFPPGTLPGFVAPPPAAFLALVFQALPPAAAQALARLAQIVPLLIALVWQERALRDRSPNGRSDWSLLLLSSVPLLFYTVLVGQPSAWLVPAAAATLLPPSKTTDTVGGVCLALAALCKATPLALIPALWWLGRRRLAVIAGGVVVAATIVTLPFTPMSAWIGFLQTVSRLSSVVIADWNNLAPDAFFTLWGRGTAGENWEAALSVERAAGVSIRIALLGAAVYVVVARSTSGSTRRHAALWLAWLSASPLLWLHYLVVLLPVCAFELQSSRSGSALMALVSFVLLCRVAGLSPFATGIGLGVVWLVSASVLLGQWISSCSRPPLGDATT